MSCSCMTRWPTGCPRVTMSLIEKGKGLTIGATVPSSCSTNVLRMMYASSVSAVSSLRPPTSMSASMSVFFPSTASLPGVATSPTT